MMKEFIKGIIKKIPIAFTKNQQYDAQTTKVLQRVLSERANAVDIGCHKGEMLDEILKFAPKGEHYCFEPIPNFYEALPARYPTNCHFYQLGLSDEKGETNFNYVITNPAYSGFQKRQYDKANEQDTLITVKTDLLDAVIPNDVQIDFIKIDVEGAEYQVLRGAINTLNRCKPIVVFEHGLGAADVYGTRPEHIFDLFKDCDMRISTMKKWLDGDVGFTRSEFIAQFEQSKNYYFIAYAE